jgi:hypothetical protein
VPPRGPVRTHTRTVNGRRVTVHQHSRKLNPGRAGRNAMRAIRATRRKKRGTAVLLAGLAVGELAGWLTLRTTSLGLTALGIGLVGIGVAARSLAR